MYEAYKSYHGSGIVCVGAIEGFDVFELEHVPLHEGFADLLIGPRDEEFVVVVCFLRQARGEVYGRFKVHSLSGKANTCCLEGFELTQEIYSKLL